MKPLARAHLLKAAYSSDGRIFVLDKEDKRHLMKSDADIKTFGDVEEAKKTIARMRALAATILRARAYIWLSRLLRVVLLACNSSHF